MSLLDSLIPAAARTLPVILLLDTSGSMQEDNKINVLNDAVTEMIDELAEADAGHGYITLSIVTFGGSSAKVIVAHTPAGEVEFSSLTARGKTPLGDGFRLARAIIEDKDALPSRAYRPTIALVSDGLPTDRNWEEELGALLASERGQKCTKFALAVGADADRDMLARFSGSQPHTADRAGEIRKFLQFVTNTVTNVTLTALDSVQDDADSAASIARLQGDDAF
ncbi:VWA domain-containing protein [Micromonospora sp. AP08]|uniref:vWA domain-containing protein n=1 Tax=Micromonospora sp. AP08 TaxID=2604467 RepID=UPI0011DB6515|nr:VWA domain-containing protein [Micromonospora sp. AP08]TYB39714.1 VWA domain-containing protein [Micromonospora sp. AP08]